jgi:muramoyltetrapeptide carboxypeptidase
VVSPAGPVTTMGRLTAGLELLRSHKFEVTVVGPLRSKEASSFLSASDSRRSAALRKALRGFDAVWFTRGGYGSARLLQGSGWDVAGPWLIGFSDATSLLWARYARSLPGGVHGPVVNGLSTEPSLSIERVLNILKGQPTAPLTLHHLSGPTAPISGPVIAGNLTVATSLLGTPFMPSLAGHIVVLEDVAEPSYKVDRMLTQWHLAGAFEGVKAIVFGTFDPTPNTETLQVLAERTDALGIPVYICSSVGHHGEVSALPIGSPVKLSRSRLHL